MMLIGGIDSAEPWVFSKKMDIFWGLGSLRNALLRVFYLKWSALHSGPYSGKILPCTGGGGCHKYSVCALPGGKYPYRVVEWQVQRACNPVRHLVVLQVFGSSCVREGCNSCGGPHPQPRPQHPTHLVTRSVAIDGPVMSVVYSNPCQPSPAVAGQPALAHRLDHGPSNCFASPSAQRLPSDAHNALCDASQRCEFNVSDAPHIAVCL